MKKYIALCALAGCILSGCNESEFLKETPEDFMSTSNAFLTETDFDMSINDLYNLVRLEFYSVDENTPFDYIYGTDLIYDGEPGTTNRHGNMLAAYDPTANIPKVHWTNLYKIIAEANTIIDRIEASDFSEDVKTQITAKARFFRGLSYRTLGYLYGGVPLELHEVETPKTDYVRSTREETLTQAKDDVLFAAENLPDITAVRDGEVSSPAAYHLLGEIYLALGMDEEAEKALTKVIDNPALDLMRSRFGSRMNEPDRDGDGQPDGDLYWDLFRQNNQNRGAGNTEGIWVIQFETDLPGGGSSTVDLKIAGNYMLERHHGPQGNQVHMTVNGNDYQPFSLWPVGDYTGGRGIGWGVSTKYFSNTIWESDWSNDIRNSKWNFNRIFEIQNPDLIALGYTEIDTENPPAELVGSIPQRGIYAYSTKCTTPYNHPDELYDDRGEYTLKSIAGTTFTDQYMFRLAETYLLRAEAYLNLNHTDLAADDINEVRSRAGANPVADADVTLDYILDERMRELGIEEKRRLTLMRTGTLYDRVMKCNPYYADPATNGDGVGMQEHYNLWPIPYSAIEANIGAKLEQNPGYND